MIGINSLRQVTSKLVVILACSAALLCISTPGLASSITLGDSQSFAVLGASTVTNTGSTTLWGNLGVSPGTAITGFFGTVENDGPGVFSGSAHQADALAGQAQSDANAAYVTLAGMGPGTDLTGQDLGSLAPLAPGVYSFTSSAQLTGTLTLDYLTNPTGDFVFLIASTLTTASASSVNVLNGGANSGLYWQVGSSATLGSGTVFAGNILALDSITLNSTAKILCGRAIALTGAVTMITNTISNDCSAEDFSSGRSDFGSTGLSGVASPVPEPATLVLLGFGLVGAVWQRRRMGSRRA